MTLPVSLDDAKDQLRVDGDSQDVEIEGFILDAAGWVERYTGHILEERPVTEQVRGRRSLELRAWPIAATAVPDVIYADTIGSPFPVMGARVDASRRPARVSPGTGSLWPIASCDQQFTVTINAGYADPEDVPRNLRRAMLIMIGAYDADREGGDIFLKAEATARRLCADYRIRRL